MSRYAQLQDNPPQLTYEEDLGFTGLDTETDRDKLDRGKYSRGENTRCHRIADATGAAVTQRGGVQTPVFANVVPMTILGSGVFSNPNGEEVQLHATATGVQLIKSGSYPRALTLPMGTTLTGKINFSQQFNVVLLHREDGGPTLVWDGITSGFTRVNKFNPADTSTVIIPNPPWSINFGYRAVFPTGPDTLGASDELDYTSIDIANNNFRINTGEAASIVGAHAFRKNQIIVGNSRSLDVLTGFIGDLANASMDVLNTEVNLAARKAMAMVGADLFLLASKPAGGVFRVSEIDLSGSLMAEPVPVSDKVQTLIDRINWPYAGGAIMQTHGIYLFVFAPIDDSTVNNSALVFNTVSREWVGIDLFDPGAVFQIDDAYEADFFGTKGLYVANHAANLIHLYGDGDDQDQLGLAFDGNGNPQFAVFNIPYVFESRGYATLGHIAGDYYAHPGATTRDFKRSEFGLKTLRPSITATLLGEGAFDERILTPIPVSRSPVKYDRFGLNNWNPSNANNDFSTPGRQDYSVDWTSEFSLPAAGINVEQLQHTPLKVSTKARSRFVSYRIVNSQGRCDVTEELIESAGVGREPKRGG
jgi:hypothetical protein